MHITSERRNNTQGVNLGSGEDKSVVSTDEGSEEEH